MRRNLIRLPRKAHRAWGIAHRVSTKRMKNIFLITTVLVALATAAGSWSCSKSGDPGKVESINFGTVPVAVAALIYIAQDQQFFAANRLGISIKDYDTGTATTDALLKGDVDIAWVAEFPLVKRAFEKEKISIIAVVGRFNEQYLFGRKDRGINTVADLKGKKIGDLLPTEWVKMSSLDHR